MTGETSKHHQVPQSTGDESFTHISKCKQSADFLFDYDAK